MKAIVWIAVIAAAVYAMVYSFRAQSWHRTGKGEREGRAAYARIRRESPNSPDAQLSEAEFVDRFVRKGPSMGKATLIILLVFVPLLFLACRGPVPSRWQADLAGGVQGAIAASGKRPPAPQLGRSVCLAAPASVVMNRCAPQRSSTAAMASTSTDSVATTTRCSLRLSKLTSVRVMTVMAM